MFHSNNSVPARRQNNARFFSILAFVKICLIAFLVQAPAFATDPIDVDPNPDLTTTIFVAESERVDIDSLPQGHYVIVATAKDGCQHSYEIWVR